MQNQRTSLVYLFDRSESGGNKCLPLFRDGHVEAGIGHPTIPLEMITDQIAAAGIQQAGNLRMQTGGVLLVP